MNHDQRPGRQKSEETRQTVFENERHKFQYRIWFILTTTYVTRGPGYDKKMQNEKLPSEDFTSLNNMTRDIKVINANLLNCKSYIHIRK